jgi:tetrahydromethanopterin S-methyltransferase subunit G
VPPRRGPTPPLLAEAIDAIDGLKRRLDEMEKRMEALESRVRGLEEATKAP